MNEQKRVVGVCGSLREESTTRVALRETLAAAQAEGASTELVDLREYYLPPLGWDGGWKDAGDAPTFRAAIDRADGVVLGTPIYHGSYGSPLKTALDYSGRDEFAGKTVGLVAVAGGRFPTKGLEHLRNVCRHINAWVLPREVAIPNASDAIEDGAITDERIAERISKLGTEVTRYANIETFPDLQRAAAGEETPVRPPD